MSLLKSFDYVEFAGDTVLEQLKLRLEYQQEQLLSKATLSSTGSEVVFFKSKYPVSSESLTGINRRLDTIAKLLELLNNLIPEKLNDGQPEFSSIGD